MEINQTAAPPPEATAAIEATVRSHIRAAARKRQTTAEHAEAGIRLRVFALDPRGPISAPDLAKAQSSGWRYVLTRDGDPVATGDVELVDDHIRVSGVSRNANQARVLQRTLRNAYSVAYNTHIDGAFEPRLFEVPAFHVFAVWFHGPQDVFVVPESDKEVDHPQVMKLNDMVDLVNRAYVAKASSRDRSIFSREDP